MKVKTWIEQEVEVDISVEEAMAELCDMPTVEGMQQLMFVLNRCVGALRHCTDAALATLSPQSRQIVADALRQLALRYDPGLAEVRSPAGPQNSARPNDPNAPDRAELLLNIVDGSTT